MPLTPTPHTAAPTATETLHISLTRSTTVLRVHELAPVLEQLQSRMTAHTPFSVDLSGGLHYFENEDSSRLMECGANSPPPFFPRPNFPLSSPHPSFCRCFLGMLVGRGRHHLHSVVDEVDAVLAPYGQPPFYDERQYHVSLAWWLPDPQREGIGPDSLPTGLMDRLAALEQRLRADFVLDTDLHVERLVFATGSGFKRHSIPLRRR